ncbi:hypothetical protein [Streptomyces hydrogenans]|uniref:hypothetical protein n=1 Tax=Streptomyces hydrogenans TaxID=1873719 RepID=UPI003D75C532
MAAKKPGASLNDIAAAGGTSHTNVRRALVSAFPTLVGKGRSTIPHDMGELLAKAFKGKALARSTGQMLREDPAAVLTAAEALAELARRALEDQGKKEPAASAA